MPIRTPRGGGRWPRDVASTAEPGRAVLGGRASGAGPSPEWMVRHTLTPGDLRDLQVETIKSNVDLEDSSILMNISWILRADGCLDHVMKYKKKCIEAGSLWKPNITACKRSANMVEVNFTTSPLGDRYMALIQSTAVIGTSYVSEKELTRTSVVVHVTGESEGAVVQLTPYFHTCGNDCIRQRGTVVQCPQTGVSSPQDHDRSVLRGWLPLLLSALLVATWVLVAGIYLIWRHERIKKTSFSTTTLLPSIKVLVVYPSEICFHHTVCYFTEFLQNRCRSEVILEKWQKKKIAEMGPVQWLTTQKQAADKVIFLLSNDSTTCDGNCDKKGGPCENSQDLFHLAFNLFCSDLRSQAHLHKYVVVYFREGDITDSYRALSVCPTYRLTKDATGFCAELLRAKQRVSVGRRPRACRYSCCSL
ncbi:interleukin-17 receptor B isoform X6 [Bubalus kerabau]|uniref:interleukin-17 receptor B isoform X6 n=1 Tax=Bubalus carabanensis TaxID=3119969 RepID=UPI00244EE1AA|nr:interleukin-17 receptor B isoform X6 [Bubalus carabanensis]